MDYTEERREDNYDEHIKKRSSYTRTLTRTFKVSRNYGERIGSKKSSKTPPFEGDISYTS